MDLTLPPVDRLGDRSVRRDVLFLEPGVAASFPYDLNGAMDRNEKNGQPVQASCTIDEDCARRRYYAI